MDVNIKTLRERACLIHLRVSQWVAQKQFKDTGGAPIAAAEWIRQLKRLVSEDATKPIAQAATQARAMIYERTSPWDDGGWRLLPNADYLDLARELDGIKSEFDRRVRQNIVTQWDVLRAQAQRALGPLFSEKDYPRDIASKYAMHIEVQPLPDLRDWRVDLPDSERDAITSQMEAMYTDRIAATVADLYDRLRDVVSKALERLDGQNIFRDSLISNIRACCGIVDRLNVTGDNELARLSAEVRRSLGSLDPQGLRDSDALRRQSAETARRALERIEKAMPI